jgi:hypothetical protein
MKQRAMQLNMSNMDKFANFALGVHDKELPKYNDTKGKEKQYWQLKTGHVINP